MARRPPPKSGCFVVGDDGRSYTDVGPAISLAITLAERAREAATVYVRQIGAAEAVATIVRDEAGAVTIVRHKNAE